MRRIRGIPIMLCALLAGCSQHFLRDNFASPGDLAEALRYVDELRTGQLDDIEQHLDPSVFKGDTHALLQKMQTFLPSGTPTSVNLIGAHYTTIKGDKRKNLSFEYNFSGEWRLANVEILEHAGGKSITALYVVLRHESLEEQNRFRLAGRPPMHYLVLTLAILLPLFSIFCLILCVRTKFAGRKWPWALFTLIGAGRLSLNWTSGVWDVAAVQVMLLSAGFFKAFYGPLVLQIAFPVGPLAFLVRRRALMAPDASKPIEAPKNGQF